MKKHFLTAAGILSGFLIIAPTTLAASPATLPHPFTIGASGATAAADPFAGVWNATDLSDGSSLTLGITGAAATGKRFVVEYDNSAAACGGGPAIAYGSGTTTANTLTATLHIVCASGPTFDGAATFTAVAGKLVTEGAVFTRRF